VIIGKLKIHIGYKLLFIISSVIIISLTGCSHKVAIYVQAANDLNNGGNPVVVRLYQLTTDMNFKSETSESFWRSNQISFQRDIVGETKEIILHPREVLKLEKIKINKNANFLAVAADFYQPDKDQWQYIYDVSKYKSKKLLLAVRKNSLVITKVEK